MSIKRILRWSIVLFLLAMLPGLTVALAQDQEPAAPQAPATWNVYESEPNNTTGTADPIALGDVVGGDLEYQQLYEYCGDDYFRLQMPGAGYILIDISHNDWMQIDIFQSQDVLYHQEFQSTGTYQHHLMLVSLSAGVYYIDLWDDHCGQGNYYPYEMAVSSPLLISAAAANLGTGNVAGISFQAPDVLAFSDLNNGEERWRMFFDASDVGIKKNVHSIMIGDGGELLLSLAANQPVPGVGTATPWDIIAFAPVSYGETTAGAFHMDFDGSDWWLTASGEKLDAITNYFDDSYLISTTGTATVPYYMGYNIKLKDDDLTWWDWYNEEWYWRFEGRAVTGMPVEDIYAAAYNNVTDKMYLTILGNGKILNHAVTQKDIFAINYPGYTWGGYAWRGLEHGWNYNIDAIEMNGW